MNTLYYGDIMDIQQRYLNEHNVKHLINLWDEIEITGSLSTERLSYLPQEPEALPERISRASINPDNMVLDPFCSCGTTIRAAIRLGRKCSSAKSPLPTPKSITSLFTVWFD